MTEEDTKDFRHSLLLTTSVAQTERQRVVCEKGSYEIKLILTLWDSQLMAQIVPPGGLSPLNLRRNRDLLDIYYQLKSESETDGQIQMNYFFFTKSSSTEAWKTIKSKDLNWSIPSRWGWFISAFSDGEPTTSPIHSLKCQVALIFRKSAYSIPTCNQNLSFCINSRISNT